MRTPLVSIVIPIYKVEKWLPRCLDSCISQTYKNIEIVAVNDGSPDNCKGIINHYKIVDERVILVDKPNGGLNSARKAGIESASGDYITILDGDDFLESDAIENLLRYTGNNNDIIVGRGRYIREGTYEILDGLLGDKEGVLSSIDYVKYILTGGPTYVWAKLYRSSLLKTETEYPNLIGSEDVILSIQWGFRARKIVFIQNIIYNYVIGRPGSILSENHNKHIEGSFLCLHHIFEWASKNNQTTDIKKELIHFLNFRLYIYLHNPKNQFRRNKNRIKEINGYITSNRKLIDGGQFRIMNRLINIDVVLAHRFVYLMQKIKPTFSPGFKQFI